MTSRRNHNWFDKPSVFILSLLIMLFIFVLFITMIIGTNVSSLLERTTIEGLQSQQKSIADDIDRKIIEAISQQASLIDPSRLDDPEYRSLIFSKIRKFFPELRATSIFIYDEQAEQPMVYSDMGFSPHPIDSNAFPVTFEEEAIISIGKSYPDNLNLFSLQPIYISFYTATKTYVIALEINISEFFFNSIQTKISPQQDYSISLYDKNGILLETSQNYPVKSHETFQEKITLSHMDRLRLNSSGLIKKEKNRILIFVPSENGYIICGSLNTDYIRKSIHPILITILFVGFIDVASIILLALLFIRYKTLEEKQIQMQIDTIRTKLDPHFIFNSLNSLVGLISIGNTQEAVTGIRNLSQMIRSTLELGTYISLFDELEFIQSYVDVQRLRYGNQFEYKCIVTEESLLYEEIPKFSIQPIIENCFVHAVALIAGEEGKIHITIYITRENKDLLIRIENDGPISDDDFIQIKNQINAVPNAGKHKIGLSLINQEIKLMYGRKYGLSVEKRNPGLNIKIRLPAKNQKDYSESGT